jgi:GDP-L-fucose synthase
MNINSRILITGARGLVGSAIDRALHLRGFTNIITPSSRQFNLQLQSDTHIMFDSYKPEYVFHCAAKVGGIMANSLYPSDFFRDNIFIQTNVLECAAQSRVIKLLFLGSACAYPKYANCPILESSLLTGELEPSNRAYAIAKISGIEMCAAYRRQYGCNFIAAMPTNLYGPGDHYDLDNSHVLPGMIRRIHEAKHTDQESVTLWGTGTPTREFLYSDDLAEACIFLMDNYNSGELINIGSGDALPLAEVARDVALTVGYSGQIKWDHSKPDGTPNRKLDSSKIFGMGWAPRTMWRTGLAQTYKDFIKTCQTH